MIAVADKINNIKVLSGQLYERDNILNRECHQLKIFNGIIVRANEAKTQKELVQGILEASLEFVNFDLGNIYLIKDNDIDVVASKFVPFHVIKTLGKICSDRPELHDLFEFGKPIYISNYDLECPDISRMVGGIKTFLAVPILYDDKVRGCINLGAFDHVEVSAESCDILRTLGKHLGHVLYRFEVERELNDKCIDLEVHIEELKALNESLTESVSLLESAHQELDLERQNFHNLFNKLIDMIFVVDLSGIIVQINNAVRNKLGYPNGNLIGKDLLVVLHGGLYMDSVHPMNYLVDCHGEIIRVDSRVVHGLWDGKEALYYVAREV